MLVNLGDIKDDILVKLAESTTTTYYTDTILNEWCNEAYQWAASYKKWPFTEGRSSTTYVGGTEEWNYPENWKADSIRYLTVGGKRFQKTNFTDYKNYLEDASSGTEKIFSDFGRIYFINPNADVSGTIVVYGQYQPIDLDGTLPTDTTVFSSYDEEGNMAIANEVLSFAMLREKRFDQANGFHQRAVEILERLWGRIQDEQFGYQTKNREMFKRIDVLGGALRDDIFRRDQFY